MRQQLRAILCATAIVLSTPAHAQEQSITISGFINYIWEESPAIAESKALVNAADANKRAASKWQYNPEIEFGLDDIDGEKKTKTFGISQTIDWSGKSFSSGKTASLELQAVKDDLDTTYQNTALGIVSALSNYSTAKDIADLALKRTSLMERFASLAKKGFKAGDIDKSEYNLAQLALSEALIVQADAQNMLAENKQSLDFAIGFSLDDNYELPVLPSSLPKLPENIDEDKILNNLPNLRAIKSREAAAKSVIASARKNRLPDPTIGVTGGKEAGADMIGFSVSIPLNIFNSYGAEVDQAKAESIALAKAGQNSFHAAKTRLKASQVSYDLSRKAWVNWQENGALALNQQTDILNRKFKVGDLSATDYLVQIEQALDTQVAAKELHNKVWQSWFAWLGASGTINQWIENLDIKNSGEQTK